MGTPTQCDRVNLDPASEVYIPGARDVIVGWNTHRGYTVCTTCEPSPPMCTPIHGGREGEIDGECDRCRRSFAESSRAIEAAHDAQQDRWARGSRVEYVIEMGATAAIRCRVY